MYFNCEKAEIILHKASWIFKLISWSLLWKMLCTSLSTNDKSWYFLIFQQFIVFVFTILSRQIYILYFLCWWKATRKKGLRNGKTARRRLGEGDHHSLEAGGCFVWMIKWYLNVWQCSLLQFTINIHGSGSWTVKYSRPTRAKY